MSDAQLSQESRPRSSLRNRSMRPAPILSGSGYSLDPSQSRIGGLGEIVKVDTCPDNQDGGYGDEDYREPEDQRPIKKNKVMIQLFLLQTIKIEILMNLMKLCEIITDSKFKMVMATV